MQIQPGKDAGGACKTAAARRFRVLSIQTPVLGHSTYCGLLRRSLRDSIRCELESYWLDDEHSLFVRTLCKLLELHSPSRWLNERHLDLWLFRAEMAKAYRGRVLAQAALRAKDYSVLHFHTQEVSYCSLGLMKRIPTVITADMSAFQFSPYPPWSPRDWPFVTTRYLERRAFQAAHTVVFWSEWARRAALGKNSYLAPEKTRVIPAGVDLECFVGIFERPRGCPKRILFVGSDFVRKGGQDLLQVFLECFKDQAELHLITKASLNSEHSNVHIHPKVEAYSPEWLSLYAAADLFVLPTRQDVFGLVIIEAMAAGLPVIATNINAIPELVINGKTGLVIEPSNRDALAQSLKRLLNDGSLCRQMGGEGRKLAEQKFSAKRNYERLEVVFAQAAESGKSKMSGQFKNGH
jgi:starch synthase